MEKLTFSTPALYGDHHVLEVRKILQSIQGVVDVYASSCFHVIEVGFDPEVTSPEVIRLKLESAGYLGDLPGVEETIMPSSGRKTNTFEHLRSAISFTQEIPAQTQMARPCPGMGLLKPTEAKHG